MVFGHHSTHLLKTSFFKLVSSSPHRSLAFRSRVRRYLNNGDLTLPVGIPIETHNRTGSTHSVPGTLTQAWLMANATTIRSPPSTAVGGMLKAFPTCSHPYVKQAKYKSNYSLQLCNLWFGTSCGSRSWIWVKQQFSTDLVNNIRVVAPVHIHSPAFL